MKRSTLTDRGCISAYTDGIPHGSRPKLIDDIARWSRRVQGALNIRVSDAGIVMDVGAAVAHLHEQGFADESRMASRFGLLMAVERGFRSSRPWSWLSARR